MKSLKKHKKLQCKDILYKWLLKHGIQIISLNSMMKKFGCKKVQAFVYQYLLILNLN
jgi:hypothetical protein